MWIWRIITCSFGFLPVNCSVSWTIVDFFSNEISINYNVNIIHNNVSVEQLSCNQVVLIHADTSTMQADACLESSTALDGRQIYTYWRSHIVVLVSYFWKKLSFDIILISQFTCWTGMPLLNLWTYILNVTYIWIVLSFHV